MIILYDVFKSIILPVEMCTERKQQRKKRRLILINNTLGKIDSKESRKILVCFAWCCDYEDDCWVESTSDYVPSREICIPVYSIYSLKRVYFYE